MKNLILFLALYVLGSNLNAQHSNLNIKSGDADLDASLSAINTAGDLNFEAFKTEMKSSFTVTSEKMDNMKQDYSMQPCDIFMILEASKLSGKSVDDVIEAFKLKKDSGWGAILQSIGLVKDSEKYNTLKNDAQQMGNKLNGNGSTTPVKVNKKMKTNSKAKEKFKTK